MWSSKSPDNSQYFINYLSSAYCVPGTGLQIRTTHGNDLSLQGSHIPGKTQVSLQDINVRTDYGHETWT